MTRNADTGRFDHVERKAARITKAQELFDKVISADKEIMRLRRLVLQLGGDPDRDAPLEWRRG
jgi:hypothetical protein